MEDDANDHAAISSKLIGAASVLTAESAHALPWLASALVGDQLQDVTDQTMLNHAAVKAVAACQQAVLICSEDPGAGKELGIVALEQPTTLAAFEAIAAGANQLGQQGSAGLTTLVNRVLPPVAKAIVDHDGERRIHGIVLAFLLALSQGMARRPPAGVENGLLLAFPFPEPRMR